MSRQKEQFVGTGKRSAAGVALVMLMVGGGAVHVQAQTSLLQTNK